MAGKKYDIVIEAVHYNEDGRVAWVRLYERIGSAFTDRLIWSRDKLIERLRAGAQVVAGKRIALLAGTFEVSDQVRLVERNDDYFLETGSNGGSAAGDHLPGIPIL
jgi:hypothetical protein